MHHELDWLTVARYFARAKRCKAVVMAREYRLEVDDRRFRRDSDTGWPRDARTVDSVPSITAGQMVCPARESIKRCASNPTLQSNDTEALLRRKRGCADESDVASGDRPSWRATSRLARVRSTDVKNAPWKGT